MSSVTLAALAVTDKEEDVDNEAIKKFATEHLLFYETPGAIVNSATKQFEIPVVEDAGTTIVNMQLHSVDPVVWDQTEPVLFFVDADFIAKSQPPNSPHGAVSRIDLVDIHGMCKRSFRVSVHETTSLAEFRLKNSELAPCSAPSISASGIVCHAIVSTTSPPKTPLTLVHNVRDRGTTTLATYENLEGTAYDNFVDVSPSAVAKYSAMQPKMSLRFSQADSRHTLPIFTRASENTSRMNPVAWLFLKNHTLFNKVPTDRDFSLDKANKDALFVKRERYERMHDIALLCITNANRGIEDSGKNYVIELVPILDVEHPGIVSAYKMTSTEIAAMLKDHPRSPMEIGITVHLARVTVGKKICSVVEEDAD